jgi:hypothetical protein
MQTVKDLINKRVRYHDIEGRLVEVASGYYISYRGTVLSIGADETVQVRMLISRQLERFSPEDLLLVTDELAPSSVPETNCRHSKLKLYTGLTEQYNYCVTCGIKESDIKVVYATEWEAEKWTY